jgi:hypothetical protein
MKDRVMDLLHFASQGSEAEASGSEPLVDFK